MCYNENEGGDAHPSCPRPISAQKQTRNTFSLSLATLLAGGVVFYGIIKLPILPCVVMDIKYPNSYSPLSSERK